MVPAQPLCEAPYQLAPAPCGGTEKAGRWVAQRWLLSGRREAQSAGILAGERWSGGCGSRLGRRVCREEKVGGNWQREGKQRPMVRSVQDGVSAILGCISSDTCLAQSCHSVNS